MANTSHSGALGTATNQPAIDRGTSALARTPSPGSICTVYGHPPIMHWSVWRFVKWKTLPKPIGGDPELLRKYKDAWVTLHKESIKRFAREYHVPTLLLAGVVWIEVGGDPDVIDGIAFKVRKVTRPPDWWPEWLTVTKKPELTSRGDVSIQIRRAAEALGHSYEKLDDAQREQLIACLDDEVGNLEIVAKHLEQLKNIDFPDKLFLGSDEIRIVGARYNRGPHLTLEEIRRNTSYGDFILSRRRQLSDLVR